MPKRVDYDRIAPAFDERYRRNRSEGILAALATFVGDRRPRVVEVGCGTGHWLAELAGNASVVVGLDPSAGMLRHAVAAAPHALLVRGKAEALPFDDGSFDRVVCINVLHHCDDPVRFAREAYRVLAPGGGVLTVGLDPHTDLDRWWIYDYFPEAIVADRERYASTATIRGWLEQVGFVDVATEVAQHIPASLPFDAAVAQGFLDRRSTSQLQVIRDDQWEAGLARLYRERPVLGADLRLYGTVAWRAVSDPAPPIAARRGRRTARSARRIATSYADTGESAMKKTSRSGTSRKPPEPSDSHAEIEEWMRQVMPDLNPIVKRLDGLIRKTIPDLQYAVKWKKAYYGLPDRGWVIEMVAYDVSVNVVFLGGAKFDAPPELGTGSSRYVKIRTLEEAQTPELRQWIEEAARVPGWR